MVLMLRPHTCAVKTMALRKKVQQMGARGMEESPAELPARFHI
jgi:hypothetical protein